MRHIIVPANKSNGKTKKFRCDKCGCEWTSDEYLLDWNKYSLPAYDKCPTCKTEIYAIGTFKSDKKENSHIREA